MPHPVTCGACNATFSIPDEVWDKRVLGQVATLKCRQCKLPIEVDGRHRKGTAAVNPAPAIAAPLIAQPDPSPAALTPPSPQTEESLETKQPDPTPVGKLASPDQIAKPSEQGPAAEASNSVAVVEGAKKLETTQASHAQSDSAATSGSPSLPHRKAPDRSPIRPALTSNLTPKTVQEPPTKSRLGAIPKAASKSSPSLPDADNRSDSGDLWVVSFGEDDDRELGTTQLAETITKGLVTRDTIVWREGMGDWMPIGRIPELARYLKQETAANKLAPIVPTDDGEDQTVIYRPAVKVTPAATSLTRTLTANAAPSVMGKAVSSTLAKSEPNATRTSSPDTTTDIGQRNLIREPPIRAAARSSPNLTGAARRGDMPAHAAGVSAPKSDVALGSPVAPAVTPATAPGTKPGGPPPLRRAQPSRPELSAASTTPWSAGHKAQTPPEIVTSVPAYELAQPAATPPPLPGKEKPPVSESPAPRPAVFPPAVQSQQPFPAPMDAGPLRAPAVPSLAPRPSYIAALSKIRPKFPKWLPMAVLAGAVLLMSIMAALSWRGGENPTEKAKDPNNTALSDNSGVPFDPTRGGRFGTPSANALQGSGTEAARGSASGDHSAAFSNQFAQAAAKQRPTARFDREATEKALAPGFLKAAGCHNKGEPTGNATVTLSISPSGQVLSVTLGAPFTTSFTADCIRNALREIRVPPFQGSPGRLAHLIVIH